MTTIDDMRRLKEDTVNAARASGDWIGMVNVLADQYSDKTHFIFELLQNADDAGATEAVFDLHPDRLEFSHNGSRLFTDGDLVSIVTIGKSTKKSDYTRIGKHGIGFKAVFAYTHTPRVHSGDKHFDIVDVIVPIPVQEVPSNLDAGKTLFKFPFDTEAIPSEKRFRELVTAAVAFENIRGALQTLSIRTPLFLRHLERIGWKVNGQTGGEIVRVQENLTESKCRWAEIGDGSNTERWLVFHREIVIDAGGELDDTGKPPTGTIEVAFLEKNGHITAAANTNLVVFFPTAVETKLGFLIHGPFKTTKARDNIKGQENNNRHSDPANNQILAAAAQLAADSLRALRDLGLLDVASFNALPLRSQDFPPESLFRPVYDLVREALKTQRLLPAHGDEYICASAAKLARVRELVELFSGKQLSQLFCHEDLRWLDASITANGETADLHTFLLGLVDGVQVTPGTVAQKMTVDFFAMQTDEWLIQFYMYAGKNYDAFKDRPFVRLENGDCVLSGSLEKPNAYLPPANASCIDQAIFPLVKHSVASHQESKKFLVDKVRLREPDRIDVVIRSILPNYLAPAAHIELSKYLVDLEEIANAFLESTPENATRLIEKLKEAHFVAAVPASNPQGETVWIKPDNPTLYRRSAELEMWFAGNTSDIAWFPVAVANDNLPDALQKRLKFTQGSLLRYEPATPKREPPVRWDSKEGIYRRLEGGFDAYAEIFGLHWAVKTPSSQRAVFLWKILVAHVNLIKGTERRSGNKQFPATSTTIFNGYSVLGKICTEHAWLPRHNAQNFHKPADLLLSELPDSFEKDTSRAELASRVLGMKQPVDFSSVASAYGITAEEVELRMALTPQEMIDIERQRAEKIRVSTLFDEVSPDPKRRAEKIAEEFSITPVKPSELRERTIDPDKPKAQDDARAYLAHEYTTDGVMICQLCGIKQPVVLNGEPQFEAVDCIKINKHSEYNKLALCPNHSVMYQRGVQSPDDVRFSILKCESLEIPLNLAGNEVKLKFTSKHLGDLRAALQTITSLAETQNADV